MDERLEAVGLGGDSLIELAKQLNTVPYFPARAPPTIVNHESLLRRWAVFAAKAKLSEDVVKAKWNAPLPQIGVQYILFC